MHDQEAPYDSQQHIEALSDYSSALHARIANLEAENAELRTELAERRNQVHVGASNHRVTQWRLNKVERDLAVAQRGWSRCGDEAVELEGELMASQDENVELQKRLHQEKWASQFECPTHGICDYSMVRTDKCCASCEARLIVHLGPRERDLADAINMGADLEVKLGALIGVLPDELKGSDWRFKLVAVFNSGKAWRDRFGSEKR